MQISWVTLTVGILTLLVLNVLTMYFSVEYHSSLNHLRIAAFNIDSINCPGDGCITIASKYTECSDHAIGTIKVYQCLTGLSVIFAVVALCQVLKQRQRVTIDMESIPVAVCSYMCYLCLGAIALLACGLIWNLKVAYTDYPLPTFVLDALHEALIAGIPVVVLTCGMWFITPIVFYCMSGPRTMTLQEQQAYAEMTFVP